MTRVYLMPRIGSGTVDRTQALADGYRPKYAALIVSSGAQYVAMDYGKEPVMLVKATTLDAGTHATLAADAEVSALPEDLTQTIGGQLANVQNALETRNIPGSNLVTAGSTYRQVVRGVIIMFQLGQRLDGLGYPRAFGGGVTLSTPFNALTVGQRNALLDMANSFGFNTSSLSGTSTLRQIWKALYDQWPVTAVQLGEAF